MKKAQAAMEFLMTYGWAILVVLVVIGALVWSGILNPNQFLPTKCTFKTGLICEDHQFSAADVCQIRLNNGLGGPITVTNLEVTGDAGSITTSDNTANPQVMIQPGDAETIAVTTCDVTVNSGDRVKGTITLTYTDEKSQITHTTTGDLLTDIE